MIVAIDDGDSNLDPMSYMSTALPSGHMHKPTLLSAQPSPSISAMLQAPSSPSDTHRSPAVPTRAIVGAVLGGVAVTIICVAVVVIYCIRCRWHPTRQRQMSKNFRGTLSTQATYSTPNTSEMHQLETGGASRSKINPLDLSSIQSTSVETIKTTWDRPHIEIDTSLPVIRKSSTNASAYFLAQKRRMNIAQTTIFPQLEQTSEKETISLSLNPADRVRPSTPSSNASIGNSTTASISPICFSDLPSSSHLPLPKHKPSNSDPSSATPSNLLEKPSSNHHTNT